LYHQEGPEKRNEDNAPKMSHPTCLQETQRETTEKSSKELEEREIHSAGVAGGEKGMGKILANPTLFQS